MRLYLKSFSIVKFLRILRMFAAATGLCESSTKLVTYRSDKLTTPELIKDILMLKPKIYLKNLQSFLFLMLQIPPILQPIFLSI